MTAIFWEFLFINDTVHCNDGNTSGVTLSFIVNISWNLFSYFLGVTSDLLLIQF